MFDPLDSCYKFRWAFHTHSECKCALSLIINIINIIININPLETIRCYSFNYKDCITFLGIHPGNEY